MQNRLPPLPSADEATTYQSPTLFFISATARATEEQDLINFPSRLDVAFIIVTLGFSPRPA
jgi:hypothetical protein